MLDRTRLLAQLRQYVCAELLRRPPESIGPDDPLVSGGYLDSFSLAQLGLFIEETFGVVLDDADLSRPEFDSLRQIADLVGRRSTGSGR